MAESNKNDKLTKCYLIADEVGLGKTKSAKAVIFERIRKQGKVNCIYIASSVDLANQNMQEFVDSLDDSYSGLVEFQCKNAETVLKRMFDPEYNRTQVINDRKLELHKLDLNKLDRNKRKKLKGIFRLSLFKKNMIDNKKSYIMQLSPKTSFARETEGYDGAEDERESLKRDLENTFKCVRQILGNPKCHLDNGENNGKKVCPLTYCYPTFCNEYLEIYFALCYENDPSRPVSYYGNMLKADSLSPEKVNQILEKNKSLPVDCYNREYNNAFHICRRIRSNASAALFNPDLIILDEFQRYNNVLCGEDSYSVERMLKYLRWRFEDNYKTRVLLLSATPYKMDKKKLKIDWNYADSDPQNKYEPSESKEDSTETPYEKFEDLKEDMKKLGAEDFGDNKSDSYFVRKERKKKNDDDKALVVLKNDTGAILKHQLYINAFLKFCFETKLDKNDYNTSCNLININPGFWRFNVGYHETNYIESDDAKKVFLNNQTKLEERIYDNLSLSALINETLQKKEPDEKDLYEIPKLWVPPVDLGRPGEGKALVFTTMKVTTRCAAYYYDKFANNLISGWTNYDNASVSGETIELLLDEIKNRLVESRLDDLREPMKLFFDRRFVKRVIAANADKYNAEWNCNSYNDAVKKYCQVFHFTDMMIEWFHILRGKNSIDRIVCAFKHKPADIKEYRLHNDKIVSGYTPLDYAEMFVCDDGKEGKDKKSSIDTEHNKVDSLQDICDHFNSPLYPMVLVARSTAQEGFNLQSYGDKIMHWQLAPTVEAFLQREGRLDRPFSLTMRHKVWKWANSLYPDRSFNSYQDAWDIIEAECKNSNPAIYKQNQNMMAGTDGLVPLWVLELPDEISGEERERYEIKQILAVNEYNESLSKFAHDLVAKLKYGDAFQNE
ncbi:MAG: DEAD/DEAH box helicase family protein [Lachnospiraceae bacterium]|nr:DEAD/DEAH box helicase family protein [Lachnospiraceae bacterium]